MIDLTKDVEIGGVRYQIGRFTARDGSWILLQVAPKISNALRSARSSAGADQEALLYGFLANVLSEMGTTAEETFRRIQEHALAVCRRIENGVPMPIFVRPSTFAIRELEFDLVTVMSLTVQALVFNVTPFFTAGGFAPMMSNIMSDSIPPNSPS